MADSIFKLSKEQLNENQNLFLSIIDSISETRLNVENKEKLVEWLTKKSDFFTAPASTKYHNNFMGGLCAHSLNVYYQLKFLAENYLVEEETYIDEEDIEQVRFKKYYDDDSLKIVALFHDLSKANFYEVKQKNVQNETTGKWEKVPSFITKDKDDRFIFGSHEETSEFMIRTFLPLTIEESVAILHHHAGASFDSTQTDISVIYSKYSLATLLHLADMLSTFVIEK